MKGLVFLCLFFSLAVTLAAQSGRKKGYSESSPRSNVIETKNPTNDESKTEDADDILRIDTDLVVIPVQILNRSGKSIGDVKREEFKIFENGVEQEIAYFSNQDQPFTVALLLDMSYSSAFKLKEIQAAALAFTNQLQADDKIMVIAFDEKARVLCEPTNNQKVLRLAIEAARIGSGTSLYTALDLALNEKLSNISGRKAIVLLSDGVDTSSRNVTLTDVLQKAIENDVIVYPLQYDTYEDVQKNRRDSAQVLYDENNRPYIVLTPKEKGEREEDYRVANDFLKDITRETGGRIYRVSSTTNLNRAFSAIAEELRKIYSLGYYPSSERKIGGKYTLNVRVYRPNLKIKAKDSYQWRKPLNR